MRSSPIDGGSTGWMSDTSPRAPSMVIPSAAPSSMNTDAGRPRLRRAGDRIERRPLARPARKAAEQLGQPVEIDHLAGAEHRLEQPQRQVVEAVAGEAGRDERVVVRPDRSVVIRHRVVAQLGRRPASGSPSPRSSPRPSASRRCGARRAGSAIPLQSACPAFELRTRQGCFVPSSASTNVPSASSQKVSAKRARSTSALRR